MSLLTTENVEVSTDAPQTTEPTIPPTTTAATTTAAPTTTEFVFASGET